MIKTVLIKNVSIGEIQSRLIAVARNGADALNVVDGTTICALKSTEMSGEHIFVSIVRHVNYICNNEALICITILFLNVVQCTRWLLLGTLVMGKYMLFLIFYTPLELILNFLTFKN